MPGHKQIYVPGEIEEETRQRRSQDGLPIEDTTWEQITAVAAELGVAVPTL